MKQLYKFKPITFFYWILTAAMLCTLTWKTTAAGIQLTGFRSPLTVTPSDTTKLPLKNDSAIIRTIKNLDTNKLAGKDTSIQEKVDTFTLKISKDSLEAPLKYAADDSAVVLIAEKKIILYGKTKTEYKDIILTAPKVEVDQQTQIVTAVNSKDSNGVVIETAHFKSGDNEFTSDTIRYNFKTQVGLTKNTYTMQGEFLFIAQESKKVNENTTFAKGVVFTTCLLDDPHFGIKTNKMKIINQKLAVSGPAHLEFEGVPIPIYVPFGFYPLSQGRHSGLMPPRFATNEQFGLGLEGLGYYKVLSQYWDAKVYGNLYSYGGWSMNVNPTYRKRYRYSGVFNLSVQNTRQNFKGDPDYFNNKSYFVTWSHSVDGKARPGTSFSANVNAGSTKYNQLVPNSNRINFQNQLGSSITYSKSWAGKPYNLTMSANHNQNNTTRLINLSLPDVGFTVNTLYPFQGKNQVGTTKWYEKLGLGYAGNFRNQVSFYDTAFKLRDLIDTLQWGAQHSFPIILSLPPILGGAVIVAPSVSYSQVWIAQKMRRKWNTARQKADTTVTKGFFTDHQMNFALSFSTALFGTYQFKKSRIIAIRHVIRPSISMNYKPDLSKKHFYTDTISPGFAFRTSEYEGALYSGFGEGRTGGLSFSLDNNLEMKWRSKKDTGENAIKKIKLIDGYGLSTGYNFLRDSMKLDLISLYLRATLFEKINITANTVLNPYQTDARGADISKYAWEGGKFKLGRLTYGSISMSSSFSSKPKDPKKDAERKKQNQQLINDPAVIADQQRLMEYMQQNPAEFVDFNIPWQLTLGYSLFFSTRLKTDLSGFEKEFSSNVNFSGSFNLTPKWNFSMNGYYDFDTKQLQTFQMSINREMHCWQLSINVTPVGLYRSFNFSISPKASVLQDLKINRTRSFTNF
ncbi:MAG: putative LPS assembly protein LptD [Bacteroidota bacterium]|nr:putative LPS assembly protein LptD [Bacteroidota bacterium]